MLSKLVFGLFIMSAIYGSGTETVSSFEGLDLSTLVLLLIIEIAGAYIGVYLFLKGAKDAAIYIRS